MCLLSNSRCRDRDVRKHPRRRKMRNRNPRRQKQGSYFVFVSRENKRMNVLIFMSKMLQNSPTSIFNSKMFLGGDTPHQKWRGKERGRGCVAAYEGMYVPAQRGRATPGGLRYLTQKLPFSIFACAGFILDHL